VVARPTDLLCGRTKMAFRSKTSNRYNASIQGAVEKLRFSIPSALRAPAAPDLER
jgi:hypothetical protein